MVEQLSTQSSGYFQQRIEEILAKARSPEWRRETYTFYRHLNPEARRRVSSPLLNPYWKPLRVDKEGNINMDSTRLTTKIGPEYEVFGPTQRGRNYHLEPPKTKTLVRRTYSEFKGGIEPAIRGTTAVRDKYRLDNLTEGSEAWQVMTLLDRVSQLRARLVYLPDLGEEDLVEMISQNFRVMERVGLRKPKLTEKQRVAEILPKGFVDRRGRKNPLAAHVRLFAIELALRKRLEGAFPPILAYYSTTVEVLRYERELVRRHMAEAEQILGDLLEMPIFADPNFSDQSDLVKARAVKAIQFLPLDRTGFLLARQVRVKPYLPVARQVVQDLGFGDLPEGTEASRNQQRRDALRTLYKYYEILPEERHHLTGHERPLTKDELEELEQDGQVLTVRDYLSQGEFTKARVLIVRSQSLIHTALEENKDKDQKQG